MKTCGKYLLISFLLAPFYHAQNNSEPYELRQLEDKIKQIAKQNRAYIVAIKSDATGSSGSGVLVSEDGLILTAAHVIELLPYSKNSLVKVLFDDGEERLAEVLGYNRTHDIGMVKLRDEGPWPHAKMGKTSDLKPGHWTLALGHPEGYNPVRRAPLRFGRIINNPTSKAFLKTDCVLIGGDSGGPLFDLEGRLIGIHSSIGQSREHNSHVRIEAFKDDWEQLLQKERWGNLDTLPMNCASSPLMGVAFNNRLTPLIITQVLPNTGAANADLRRGDIVLAINGHPVQSYMPFCYILHRHEASMRTWELCSRL